MASQAPGLPPGFVLDPVPQPMPNERITQRRLPPAQTPANAERDRLEAALAAERLARERAERQVADARRPGQLRAAEDPAGEAPAAQRSTAGFYLRALRANEMYGGVAVPPRGVVGQSLADAFPRLGNAVAGTERQQAEALQRDFIAATLRYESGAAIPPSEFESQSRIYFPQPGDTPETIALKATLRQNAIEALQRSAGPAANGIEPAPLPVDLGRTGDGIVPTGAANLARQGIAVVQPPAGPTVTDPNEGPRSQVIAGAPSEQLSTVMAPGERYTTDQDRQLFDGFAARVQAGQSREEIQTWLNQAYPGAQVTDEQWRGIEEGRRFHRDIPLTPGASGVRSPQEIVADAVIGGSTGEDAFVAGAVDSASLGLPGLFSENYRSRRDDLRAADPLASIAGNIVGGIAAPGGPRAGMGLGAQSARSAFQGGAYGFNSTGGDPASALLGAGIGAAAPPAFNVLGRGANRVRSAFTRGDPFGPESLALAQAADDEGVRVSRPILDPGSRDRMAYLEASRGTGNVVRGGLEETRAGIEQRVSRLGEGGTAEDAGVMGQRIQDAGTRYIRESGGTANRMYSRAEELAGDTRITPANAVAVLDQHLVELGQVPGGAPAVLTKLRDDLNGEFTVSGLRNLRTRLRDDFRTQGLTGSDIERRAMQVVSALSDDINGGLTQAGRADAAAAYRAADTFYAQRQDEISNVIQSVIGRRDANLPGEQVMVRVRQMAGERGNSARLRRLWNHLDPEERLDAAATIAETAGRKSAEEPFTPGQFVNWARTLSPDARRTVFGPEGAASITNLNRLSRALLDTTSRLNNSRSGMVRNWGQSLREILSGGGAGVAISALSGGSALTTGATGMALGAAAAGTGAAIRRLSARALMSPDISRWLAAAGRQTTPAGIRSHIEQLQVIARTQRNPALAQEVLGLRSALLNAVNDNYGQMTRAAASSGDDEEGRQ